MSFFIATTATAKQTDAKLWTSAKNSGLLNSQYNLRYYLEPQLRFLDDTYKLNQANLYAAIYKNISSDLSLWGGVFRGYDQEPSGSIMNENRLWQQVIWDFATVPAVTLSSRSRLEERQDTQFGPIAFRFRERLTAKIPLPNKNMRFVAGNEFFIQLNKPHWVSDYTFAQNRASVGFEIPINTKAFYEIGYTNQYVWSQNPTMSNILYFSIDFDPPDEY